MRAATLLVTLLGLLPQVLTSGSFELRLRSFTNHLGRLTSGLCCDGSSSKSDVCTLPCRTRFRVCLKTYQANIDTTSPCTFGSHLTPVLGGNTMDMMGLQVQGFTNPIVFNFNSTWPGTFSLIVEAWHDSNETSRSDDNLIARMTIQSIADVGGPWEEEEQLWSSGMNLRISYRVRCAHNYYGAGCEVLCRPRDDAFGHYTCSTGGKIVCIPGWIGDYCTKPQCLEGCDTEHGHCLRPNECRCQPGWYGELCDKCERHPGCVHGTCQKPWDCICEEGWGGLFCNQDLNYCTHHRPCKNGGTCHNTGQGSYTCHCPPDFIGDDCEISLHSCATEPCTNGGVCKPDDDDQLTCVCPEGFSGARCETRTVTCADGPCLNGGTCSMFGGGYFCACAPGYEGADCERETDPCEDDPCTNGAKCSRVGDGFHCACPPGYEGARCEINIDDCVGVVCERGGTCMDLVGGYHCRCAPGFVGTHCETRVDLCVAKPCANGGECTKLDNDYMCRCRPGFAGKDCGIEIDECASNPCTNGGICRDRVDGFTCTCPSGYTGRTCSVLISATSSKLEGDLTPVRGYVDDTRDESLSGKHVALIAALSATVPALALVAAVALACIKRRRRRSRAAADAEARAQNERNAISAGGRVIRNTWGKGDAMECQNAHNASRAGEDCKEVAKREQKLLNTESAARLLAARLSACPDDYCNTSDTSLVKRALEGGGVFVLDEHCLPPTFATQV